MRGNLADLAATGIASEPTLRKWIAAEPDQAWILKRGSNGDAYEIDIPGAVAAFQAGEEAKAQAARDRAGMIRQLAMDLGINQGEAEQSAIGLSIAERKQLLEEELVAIKVGQLRRELVSRAEVDAELGDVLTKFRQRLSTLSARLAKKIDLDRNQINMIDSQIAADLADLARMMEGWKGGDDSPATGRGSGAAASLEAAAGDDGR
jgi:hypothetical protein